MSERCQRQGGREGGRSRSPLTSGWLVVVVLLCAAGCWWCSALIRAIVALHDVVTNKIQYANLDEVTGEEKAADKGQAAAAKGKEGGEGGKDKKEGSGKKEEEKEASGKKDDAPAKPGAKK